MIAIIRMPFFLMKYEVSVILLESERELNVHILIGLV